MPRSCVSTLWFDGSSGMLSRSDTPTLSVKAFHVVYDQSAGFFFFFDWKKWANEYKNVTFPCWKLATAAQKKDVVVMRRIRIVQCFKLRQQEKTGCLKKKKRAERIKHCMIFFFSFGKINEIFKKQFQNSCWRVSAESNTDALVLLGARLVLHSVTVAGYFSWESSWSKQATVAGRSVCVSLCVCVFVCGLCDILMCRNWGIPLSVRWCPAAPALPSFWCLGRHAFDWHP